MTYDGSNPLHAAQARARLERLVKDGKVFDLTEKKPKRSRPQNRYLHVLLGYFASQTGNTLEWVKKEYYKRLVNPDTFIREKPDPYLGRAKYLRSSADLDTAEMTLTIDRFRDWAATEAGIYLPAPDEERLIQLAELEMERYKEYM